MSASLKKFWDFEKYQEKEWFRILGIMLISIVTLYILLHLFLSGVNKQSAFEYTKLDANQIQQINRIYFDSIKKSMVVDTIPKAGLALNNKKKNESVIDTTKANNDTSKNQKIIAQAALIDKAIKQDKDSSKFNNNSCERVIKYLRIEFPNSGTSEASDQIDSLKSYLCTSSNIEATSFLSNFKFKANSFFWLTGAPLYIEIIFWTLFGVLCSLLFNLGIIAQKSTNNPQDDTTYFDSSEIPSQVAKLFYAPLCTLVIVLGYNLISNPNPVDIYAGKGMLVFAFIGGYYSSRLISFLDRFKDLLLPNSGTTDTPKVAQPALKNILIEMILPQGIDPTTLTPTTIALTDKTTGDNKLNATKVSDNPTIFIADFAKPAKYTIAALSFQAKNASGAVIQLATDAKDIEMKTTDLFISLVLK